MQALLMSKELWMLVDDEEPCPPSTEPESRVKWLKRAQKAAGELYLAVEQDQKLLRGTCKQRGDKVARP